MERNPWKLATIGMALVGTTAFGTGITTAYVMRGPASGDGTERAAAPLATPAPRALVSAPVASAPRPLDRVAAPARPRVTPVSTAATTRADCDTGGERALRIAKPGVIGALLGAGLGAAGGAIADGGKAAGKGALIGGLAGAAVGTGYGAYQTKNECGTILGDRLAAPAPALAPPATLDGARGEALTVYNAR
jgi:hypothetical protein